MSSQTAEFGLLFVSWVVAFLLGKELQSGFRAWRARAAENPVRRDE